jgi:HK97 gp10 family phage protein
MPSKGVRLEIARNLEAFRFSELGLREILNGPVMKDMIRRAIRVEAAAKSSMGEEEPPSTPGSPPAVRTGRLRGSITWRVGVDAESPYVDVGTAVYYAVFLELGTRYMAPRPFLRPALEAAGEGTSIF